MTSKVLIDADGCPVVDMAISISYQHQMDTFLYCDTSHQMDREHAITIVVPKGPDSVDFKLVNAVTKNDIVITQDYGLAAMCLAKGAFVLDQNGREMNSENIDQLCKLGIKCTLRQEHGADIDAACGQLRAKQEKQRGVLPD